MAYLARELCETGYAVIPSFLTPAEVKSVADSVDGVLSTGAGTRRLIRHPWCGALSFPVAEQADSPECSGWSEKEGEVFCQPPVSVLQSTLAVRIHIDDCDESNGALRVVPGSHR